MASISVKNLRVSYNKRSTYALKDLDLKINDGAFCVFLGPSGCGKSTAMHCIAGLIHPESGELKIGDTLVTSTTQKEFVPPQERNIAMVFQEYALYPNMTVRGNMSFALQTKKVPKGEIARRVDEMAKMLSIEHLLDRKPAELSGGQRQRVALGRALVRDPSVFLLDEPLGNLDAKLRDQVRYELKKIQSKLGITTVYVTHDQTEAMTMADHIVLMKDGEIVQEGTPHQLYSQPKDLFVAGFLGTPQINTFDCTVCKSESGELFFRARDFSLPMQVGIKAQMERFVDREVVLGIRPSDCKPEEKGAICGSVDSVEPLGDAYLVYLNIGSQIIIVKIAGGNGRFGETMALAPDAEKLHVFDKATGNRVN